MHWRRAWSLVACLVAGDILCHQVFAEAADAASPLRLASGTLSLPPEQVEDPAINKALPVVQAGNAGGNLVIMRNTGERAVSVSFADAPRGIRQLLDPGGSLVWSCGGDTLPPVSLQIHSAGQQHQRTLRVVCGDVLVIGGNIPRLTKYEAQEPLPRNDERPDLRPSESVEDARTPAGWFGIAPVSPSLLEHQPPEKGEQEK